MKRKAVVQKTTCTKTTINMEDMPNGFIKTSGDFLAIGYATPSGKTVSFSVAILDIKEVLSGGDES